MQEKQSLSFDDLSISTAYDWLMGGSVPPYISTCLWRCVFSFTLQGRVKMVEVEATLDKKFLK